MFPINEINEDFAAKELVSRSIHAYGQRGYHCHGHLYPYIRTATHKNKFFFLYPYVRGYGRELILKMFQRTDFFLRYFNQRF